MHTVKEKAHFINFCFSSQPVVVIGHRPSVTPSSIAVIHRHHCHHRPPCHHHLLFTPALEQVYRQTHHPHQHCHLPLAALTIFPHHHHHRSLNCLLVALSLSQYRYRSSLQYWQVDRPRYMEVGKRRVRGFRWAKPNSVHSSSLHPLPVSLHHRCNGNAGIQGSHIWSRQCALCHLIMCFMS